MATVKDMDRLLQSFVDNGLPGCGLKIEKKGNVIYYAILIVRNEEVFLSLTGNSLSWDCVLKGLPPWSPTGVVGDVMGPTCSE